MKHVNRFRELQLVFRAHGKRGSNREEIAEAARGVIDYTGAMQQIEMQAGNYHDLPPELDSMRAVALGKLNSTRRAG